MTVKECYSAMGADYEDAAGRLRTDERLRRFLLKIPGDKSFELLLSSIQERNMEEAFRAAHTIKGICQNLSLTKLFQSSSVLSDRLRDGQEYGEDIEPMVERVKEDYEHMISCIGMLEN